MKPHQFLKASRLETTIKPTSSFKIQMLWLLSTHSARYCVVLRHTLLFRLHINSVSLKDNPTLGGEEDGQW